MAQRISLRDLASETLFGGREANGEPAISNHLDAASLLALTSTSHDFLSRGVHVRHQALVDAAARDSARSAVTPQEFRTCIGGLQALTSAVKRDVLSELADRLPVVHASMTIDEAISVRGELIDALGKLPVTEASAQTMARPLLAALDMTESMRAGRERQIRDHAPLDAALSRFDQNTISYVGDELKIIALATKHRLASNPEAMTTLMDQFFAPTAHGHAPGLAVIAVTRGLEGLGKDRVGTSTRLGEDRSPRDYAASMLRDLAERMTKSRNPAAHAEMQDLWATSVQRVRNTITELEVDDPEILARLQ